MNDAINLPEQNTDGDPQLDPGTLAEHWKKGIPTLILACVGLFVFLYSGWMVRPNLPADYLSRASAILAKNNIPNVLSASDGNSTNDAMSVLNVETSRTFSTLNEWQTAVESIEELQIRLRRLIGQDNQNAALHLQTAFVEQAYSELLDCGLKLAETNQSNPQPNSDAAATNSVASSDVNRGKILRAKEKMIESLRRVEKIGGRYAPTASGWLIQMDLESGKSIQSAALADYESRLRKQIAASPDDRFAKQALAMVLVETAIRPSSSLQLDQRQSHLNEAASIFDAFTDKPAKIESYIAYANVIQNPALSRETAAQAAQEYWLQNESAAMDVSNIGKVFTCLLLSGNPREAQLLTRDAMANASPDSQSQLRLSFCESVVKYLQSQWIVNQATATQDANANAQLLMIAIQLNPRSDELHSLLQSLSDQFQIASDAQPQGAAQVIAVEKLLQAMKQIEAGDAINALKEVDPILAKPIAIFLSSNVMNRSVSGAISIPDALKIVEQFVLQYDDAYPVWFDQASLLIKMQAYGKAIECLERLQAKLPNNEEVRSMIQGLKDGTIK